MDTLHKAVMDNLDKVLQGDLDAYQRIVSALGQDIFRTALTDAERHWAREVVVRLGCDTKP